MVPGDRGPESSRELPSTGYQLPAYVVSTASGRLVSITCLEFCYTLAAKRMKLPVMTTFFMCASIGNLFTAAVNLVIQNPDGSSKRAGADWYFFFVCATVTTA